VTLVEGELGKKVGQHNTLFLSIEASQQGKLDLNQFLRST